MLKSWILASQICLLTLFAKIKLSQKFLNLLFNCFFQAIATSPTYSEAVQLLGYTPTAAPVYFIIAGANPGEGAVITKGRLEPEDIWTIDPNTGRWKENAPRLQNYFHAQLNWARNFIKTKIPTKKNFLTLSLSDVVFIMLINVKMPTIDDIFTCISRINSVLSWVEHEKSFMTSGPMAQHMAFWHTRSLFRGFTVQVHEDRSDPNLYI